MDPDVERSCLVADLLEASVEGLQALPVAQQHATNAVDLTTTLGTAKLRP